MSETSQETRPAPDPSSWCWAAGGHFEAALESVQDARTVPTRGKARARYARDIGDLITEVAVWRRYGRSCDRQEKWEAYCEALGWYEADPDGEDGAEREMPATPPADWTPDPWNEDIPEWEFCRPDDDGAVPVWVCGPRGTRAPHKPSKAVAA